MFLSPHLPETHTTRLYTVRELESTKETKSHQETFIISMLISAEWIPAATANQLTC